MKTLIALFAVLSAVSCSNKHEFLTDYQVIVDPALTPNEMEDIANAATAWELAVPIQFQVSIGDCIDPQETQICVRRSLNPGFDFVGGVPGDIDGITYPEGDRGIIYLYPRSEVAGDEFFEQAVLHELGHAQGLVHHVGCYVMNPFITECSKAPSKDDINQWLSIKREPWIQ